MGSVPGPSPLALDTDYLTMWPEGLHKLVQISAVVTAKKFPSCSSVSFRQAGESPIAGESEPSSSYWEPLAGYSVESNLIKEAVQAILVDTWGFGWDRVAYSDFKEEAKWLNLGVSEKSPYLCVSQVSSGFSASQLCLYPGYKDHRDFLAGPLLSLPLLPSLHGAFSPLQEPVGSGMCV